MLHTLKKHGVSICIATNKRREFFQAELATCDVASLISYSCCGDEYPPKPDASMLNTLMQKTSSKASECIMIGDHHNDIIAANHACMASIAVTSGSQNKEQLQPHQPSYICSHITDVLNWLELEQLPA